MKTTESSIFSFNNTLITTLLLSIFSAVLLLALSGLILATIGLASATSILTKSGFSWSSVSESVQTGLQTTPTVDSAGHKNFLVLGLDVLDTRPGSKPLTDTILIVSLDTNTNTVSMISLPRDLWIEDLDVRINALFSSALEKNLEPAGFVEAEIENLTDIEVHHTVVVTLDTVAELVDSLGGVQVHVDQSFTDSQFPKSNVDVTIVSDPNELYETVIFEQGTQTLDGTRALQFARSRHASGSEGTDLARSARQQKLLTAIAEKLLSADTLQQPEILVQLGQVYKHQFEHEIPLSELTALVVQSVTVHKPITFSRGILSIYPDSLSGVLVHPPEYAYNGQWVYIVRDIPLFKNEVRAILGYSP